MVSNVTSKYGVQAGHVQRLFSTAEEEHKAAVKSFRQQSAAQDASDAQWQHSQLQAGVGGYPPATCSMAMPASVSGMLLIHWRHLCILFTPSKAWHAEARKACFAGCIEHRPKAGTQTSKS